MESLTLPYGGRGFDSRRLHQNLGIKPSLFDELEKLDIEVLSATEEFMNAKNIDEEFTRNVMMAANQHARKKDAQRIRDKVKEAKSKGYWTGGTPPLGYDVDKKQLIINKAEAVEFH